jgi:hypothetical protein
VSFKINQDYIAKNLCENRAKPKMQCNGKCQLMKKLEKAEKEEQKQTPPNLKEKVEVLYCQTRPPFDFLKATLFYENKALANYDCDFYSSSFITDIFRPPKNFLT